MLLPAFATVINQTLSDEVVNDIVMHVHRAKGVDKVNEQEVRTALQDILNGLHKIADALFSARLKLAEAKLAQKQAEAIAGLERFKPYCTENKLKGTADERSFFVSLDKDVISSSERVAFFDALVKYLDSLSKNLFESHTDLRMSYKNSNNISSPITGGAEEGSPAWNQNDVL